MKTFKRSSVLIMAIICAVSLLAGCSKLKPKLDEVLPDKRTVYKKSKSLPDLEVPPDLTTDAIRDQMAIPQGGETATYSTYQERQAQARKQRELESTQDSAIQVLENEHILAVQGAAIQIWPQLRAFWNERGYGLELDDEELGVIETEWRENQEDLTRDKYKIFAEAGEQRNTTVLYVSHRGEQLVPQGEKLVWQPREREVQLERAIVENLRDHLGVVGGTADSYAAEGVSSDYSENAGYGDTTDESGSEARSEILSAGSGKIYVALQEEFSDAWESTAAALSAAGIEVDEADKSRGVFSIKIPKSSGEKKEGVFSKLKFWGGKSDNYQLSLTGVGAKTELVLLDADGKWETSESGANLLRRVHEALLRGAGR
ncbi:MAG: outer membrane protein assembly factor BamC [Gammaproteobacteria bacterium]